MWEPDRGRRGKKEQQKEGVSVSFSIRSLIFASHLYLHNLYFSRTYPPTSITQSHYIVGVRPSMYVAKVAGFSASICLCRLAACPYDGTPGLGPSFNENEVILGCYFFFHAQMLHCSYFTSHSFIIHAPHPLIVYVSHPFHHSCIVFISFSCVALIHYS